MSVASLSDTPNISLMQTMILAHWALRMACFPSSLIVVGFLYRWDIFATFVLNVYNIVCWAFQISAAQGLLPVKSHQWSIYQAWWWLCHLQCPQLSCHNCHVLPLTTLRHKVKPRLVVSFKSFNVPLIIHAGKLIRVEPCGLSSSFEALSVSYGLLV